MKVLSSVYTRKGDYDLSNRYLLVLTLNPDG